MRAKKKIAAILVMLVLCCGMMPSTVLASKVIQDGLEIALSTDKSEYQDGEKINISLAITNTNNKEVTNLSIRSDIPEGYKIAEGMTELQTIELLKAGEKETISLSFEDIQLTDENSDDKKEESSEDSSLSTKEDNKNGKTTTTTTKTTTKTTSTKSTKTKTTSTKTGDDTNLIVPVLFLLGSGVLIAVLLVVKRKSAKRLLSFVLCASLLGGSLPFYSSEVSAAEKETKIFTLSETIKINEQDTEVKVSISYDIENTVEDAYDDSEEQVIPKEVAELYGIDPDEYDSDGDQISNYIEIFVIGTSPTLTDSDGNGISDADEDFDADGISNIKEVELGTDLDKEDSDKDGLKDFEEINEYKTDPCVYDTDGDTLGDGDEILLGLNPLTDKTDGTIHDSERKITQDLEKENISEQLLSEDNKAVPSLSLTACGNINKSVVVEETSSGAFNDSRAIVGEAVDIAGDDVSDGTLTFSLTDSSPVLLSLEDTEETFNTNIICRYNADGTTDYLDTIYDAASNSVSADIDREGTYFVLNVKHLFNELGLTLPAISDVNALTDPEPAETYNIEESSMDENGENTETIALFSDNDAEAYEEPNVEIASADTEKLITRTGSDAMAQADIVFLIDTTSSMGNEINNVKENIGFFVDALKEKGVSAGLALVEYEDISIDGYNSTRVHKNGDSNWFYDMDGYKTSISNLRLGYGGDKPESAVDALETGRLLDMRASAGKIFVLVTDADYKVTNRYGIPSMAAEIELLKNAGINCSVVSPSREQNTYYNLYTDTDGIWMDIYGDFYSELMTLADKIGDDIVGDGYWIYLQGPVPVPVRLDAAPEVGSSVDTDKDGITDIEELGSATPTGTIDLDALITKISLGAITGTDYGTVMMYAYNSNPGEVDTDYDGTNDDQDTAPNNNKGTGIMHYSVDDASYTCNIEFTMDYRQLIDGNNEIYSKDLSMLSVLLATDVYDNSYIETTDFAQIGGNDEPTTFGTHLGLSDSQYIQITGEEYAFDQDDTTDFYVGHRNITYNKERHEVIVVSVRGTNGTHREWSSNFDIGADSSEYYSATGYSHPDWKNKHHHKGFDVAANRVYNKLNAYIEENVDSYAKKHILITGHSRGAAIANILGSYFENDQNYDSYTYTYASPNTTTASTASNYSTIFNVVNTDDIITFIPLESWGFTKYGVTKAVCVEDYYENELGAAEEGSWEWFIGQDYNNDSSTQSTLSAFAKIADNREGLYILGTTDAEKVWEDDLGHTTYAGAEEELASLSATLEEEKLLKFCNMYIVNSFLFLYHVEINYCPAYLLQTLANMTTGVGPLLGRDVAGKYADAKTAFVASSGKVVIGGMTHPHMPPTYYIMAYHNLESLY